MASIWTHTRNETCDGLRVAGCGFSRPEGTFHSIPPIHRWDKVNITGDSLTKHMTFPF